MTRGGLRTTGPDQFLGVASSCETENGVDVTPEQTKPFLKSGRLDPTHCGDADFPL